MRRQFRLIGLAMVMLLPVLLAGTLRRIQAQEPRSKPEVKEGQATIRRPVRLPAVPSDLPPEDAMESDPRGLPIELPPADSDEDPIKQEAAVVPLPPEPIPDNPPPHEGAIFRAPIRIQPPDLLLVEVLDALPGRPVTGERLVRPDGTVSLGFYGDVDVAGLTLAQAKAKIVYRMRRCIPDKTLGLLRWEEHLSKWTRPTAEQTDRVFVDITAYNSSVYYVQGWVATPGRLPWTGRDTVLDAINYAGGLLPHSAEQKILLFRPARGNQPIREYEVDFTAVQRGEARANLQLFAGDRLIVSRIGNGVEKVELPPVSRETRPKTEAPIHEKPTHP